MAKKKEPDINDACKYFHEVIDRLSITKLFYVNKVIVGIDKDDHRIIINCESELWNYIINHNDEFTMTELDVSDDANKFIKYIDMTDGFYDVDLDKLYQGDIVEIKIDKFPYPIKISKKIIPIKLRKSEFNNIQYHVTTSPEIFIIKKKFDTSVIDADFNIMIFFKII